MLWQIQSLVSLALGVVVFGLALWALVDCVRRPSNLFPYIERKSKTLWIVITGVSAAAAFVVVGDPLNLFGIASVVVSLLYLFDMRPKFEQVGRRY